MTGANGLSASASEPVMRSGRAKEVERVAVTEDETAVPSFVMARAEKIEDGLRRSARIATSHRAFGGDEREKKGPRVVAACDGMGIRVRAAEESERFLGRLGRSGMRWHGSIDERPNPFSCRRRILIHSGNDATNDAHTRCRPGSFLLAGMAPRPHVGASTTPKACARGHRPVRCMNP